MPKPRGSTPDAATAPDEEPITREQLEQLFREGRESLDRFMALEDAYFEKLESERKLREAPPAGSA